ncbi:MAG TPA: hypothetical protein VEX43_03095 [Chthoniobacterales bacterium]|nr:hypothetical protein [Chthoniobacterales bacterium]
MFESSGETRLPLAAEAGKFIDELANGDVQIGMDGLAVNVATRQRKPRAGGKTRCGATMMAQYDLSSDCVVCEADHGGNFLPGELPQRFAETEVMSSNVNW